AQPASPAPGATPPVVQPESPKPDQLAARQSIAPGESAVKVTIANFTSRKMPNRYVEVSGTLINKNEFAIKNIVVTCGDKSYASADVSVTVDKIVPPRSDLQVAGLRFGPIRPELPPTTCVVARYERAN